MLLVPEERHRQVGSARWEAASPSQTSLQRPGTREMGEEEVAEDSELVRAWSLGASEKSWLSGLKRPLLGTWRNGQAAAGHVLCSGCCWAAFVAERVVLQT